MFVEISEVWQKTNWNQIGMGCVVVERRVNTVLVLICGTCIPSSDTGQHVTVVKLVHDGIVFHSSSSWRSRLLIQ